MWPQRFVTDLLLWIRLPFRCFKEIAIESTVDLAFTVREEPCREPRALHILFISPTIAGSRDRDPFRQGEKWRH